MSASAPLREPLGGHSHSAACVAGSTHDDRSAIETKKREKTENIVEEMDPQIPSSLAHVQ